MDFQNLREISKDNLSIIGKGATGEVYRIDDEKVLKLFFESQDKTLVQREYALSTEAAKNGVPTNKIYELVKCGDRLGLVYEYIHSDTLDAIIATNPDKEDYYIDKYVTLLKRVHGIDVSDSRAIKSVNDTISPILSKFEGSKLSHDEIALCSDFLKELDADTYIHGDAHPGNVMLRGDELVFIDMTTSAKGKPLYDIMTIYNMLWGDSYRLPADEYKAAHHFDPDTGRRIFKKILNRYYDAASAEELTEIETLCERISTIRKFLFMIYLGIKTPDSAFSYMKKTAMKAAALRLNIDDNTLYRVGMQRSYSGVLFGWDIQSGTHLTLSYRLKNAVNTEALQQAWEKVVGELPYFSKSFVSYIDKNLYYSDRVIAPKVLPESDMDPTDGVYYGKAMAAIGYGENTITLHIFHALLDGFGIGVLSRNLLYHYFVLCGYEMSRLPFDGELIEHFAETEVDFLKEKYDVPSDYEYIFDGGDKGFILPEAGDSYRKRYYYGIEMSTGKYRKLCSKVLGSEGKKLFRTNATMIGGMQTIVAAILLGRAIRELNPDNEERIAIRCPMNARNELGQPYSLMNCSLIQVGFSIAYDSFSDEMDYSVLEEISKRIDLQTNENYVRSYANVLYDYVRDISEKPKSKRPAEVADTNKTFLATNLGMIAVEPEAGIIGSMQAENVVKIPMMIQLSSIEDRQFILLTQNFMDSKYFDKLKSIIEGYGFEVDSVVVE